MSDDASSTTSGSSAPPPTLKRREAAPEEIAFRQQARRERDKIAKEVEVARTQVDVPKLLRLLIAEIQLWTRELKHETHTLFEDTEHGRFGRQMMRGRPTGLSILPGYVVLGFMVAPDAHDLVELAVGESQAQALARRFDEFDNRRRELGEAVAQLASTWDDALEKDYNKFALIDRHRSDLKLVAFDLCRYIDTLAHLAAARRAEPPGIPAMAPAGAQTQTDEPSGTDVRLRQLRQTFEAAIARLDAIPDTELSASGQPFIRECADAVLAFSAWFGEQTPDDVAIAGNAHRVQYSLGGLSGVIDWIALHRSVPFANEIEQDTADLVREADEFDDAVVKAYKVAGKPHELKLQRRPLSDGVYNDLEERIGQVASLAFRLGSRLQRVAVWASESKLRTQPDENAAEAKAGTALPASAGGREAASKDPAAVWLAAETMKCIAARLLFHSMMLRADKPSEYDDQDKLSQDFRMAERHGYLLISVARQMSLDPQCLIRILRDDRLWCYSVEKEDAAVFRAAVDLAERISTEARIWCAEAGIDPKTVFEDSPTNGGNTASGAPAHNPADADEPVPPCGEVPPDAPAGFADCLRADASPNMPPDQWRTAGLGLLMLFAQAYYKMLEGAISMASWCTALDLELNHSYLWTTQNLSNLLKNHEALRDFPVAFEPLFPDLYPSTLRDLDWDDMVAPEAERFLSTVQQYVFSKGFAEPKKGSQDWLFIELFRPAVTAAIERAVNYSARMKQHARKLMGQSPAPASTTSPKPESATSPVPVVVPTASESSTGPATDTKALLPFEIDESAFKVVMNGQTRKFSGRSKKLFALLVRISRRPGHQVPFDSLRQTGDVWDGSPVEDSSIKGAVSRLRDELRGSGMNALADAIKTGTFANRSFVILEPEGLSMKSN